MNHLEVNKKITIQNLKELESDAFRKATTNRCKDEYNFIKNYIKSDTEMLDIGARDATFLSVLKENGHTNISGTDISDEAVTLAESKGFNVNINDMHNMSTSDESFEFVSIIHVLEHSIDAIQVLREIHRILKEKGHIFIEVPIQPNEDPNNWGHFNQFHHENELIKIVREYFNILEVWKQPGDSKKPAFRLIGIKK